AQVKESRPSVQVPPFTHGFAAHSSVSVHPSTASPSKPASQTQLRAAPQVALAPQAGAQSFGAQVTPSPEKPALHSQTPAPAPSSTQAALASQPGSQARGAQV